MRTRQFIVATIITVASFMTSKLFAMNFNYVPKEDLQHTCEARIRLLDADMAKVMKTSSYSGKYRKKVKKVMENAQFDQERFGASMTELKKLLQEEYLLGMALMQCLLDTSDMIRRLHSIAEAGGKNLDNFSPTWKSYFRSQAKMMGYQMNQ